MTTRRPAKQQTQVPDGPPVPPWCTHGAAVRTTQQRTGSGLTTVSKPVTVARFTKRDVVLSDGQRFRRDPQRIVRGGAGWDATVVLHSVDDPELRPLLLTQGMWACRVNSVKALDNWRKLTAAADSSGARATEQQLADIGGAHQEVVKCLDSWSRQRVLLDEYRAALAEATRAAAETLP